MSLKDSLGNRMKEYYESIPKSKLMRRTPVAIRIDGKAFHTFTRGFVKPFDRVLMESMQETMLYLCENIQGCVFGYTQSDEITLILIDYQNLETAAWFDYEVQKMCSVAASMATMAFNRAFQNNVRLYLLKNKYDFAGPEYAEAYLKACEKGAMFDARCFNIPKEEVCNLVYWRQLDASRNSIQMVAQSKFSHKELQGKSCAELQEMLMATYGINWNNYLTDCKRGSACIRVLNEELSAKRDNYSWLIDTEMPILCGEERSYVNSRILFED